MGDGKTKQAAEQATATPADTLAGLRAAALSEQSWRARTTPYENHHGIAQAQATGDRRVGPQGTYGAPPMPGIDTAVPPVVPASPAAGAKPYTYNPDAPPPAPAKGAFKPAAYDIDKQIGGDPVVGYADIAAKMIGTGVGAKLTYELWKPAVSQSFDWKAPSFQDEPHIGAATWQNFRKTRANAHAFFRSQSDAMVKDPNVIGIPADPAMRTDAQQILQDRLAAVQRGRGNTIKDLETGNNPVNRIDFSDIDHEVQIKPGYKNVNAFATAQDALIAERRVNLTALERTERTLYDNEMRAARTGRLKDFGALFGAEAVNIGVDHVIERNRKSWWTVGVDIAAPTIMAVEMSALGKWAPVAKAGVIISSHLFSHLAFDTQVDENNPT